MGKQTRRRRAMGTILGNSEVQEFIRVARACLGKPAAPPVTRAVKPRRPARPRPPTAKNKWLAEMRAEEAQLREDRKFNVDKIPDRIRDNPNWLLEN
jgi:hypothetical protein